PTRCAAWLKPHAADGHAPHGLWARFQHGVDAFLGGLTRRYEKLLAIALNFRAVVLSAVALLFLASLGLLGFIGQEFFPQVDTGQMTIVVRCPTGTNNEKTNQRVARFEQFL